MEGVCGSIGEALGVWQALNRSPRSPAPAPHMLCMGIQSPESLQQPPMLKEGGAKSPSKSDKRVAQGPAVVASGTGTPGLARVRQDQLGLIGPPCTSGPWWRPGLDSSGWWHALIIPTKVKGHKSATSTPLPSRYCGNHIDSYPGCCQGVGLITFIIISANRVRVKLTRPMAGV